MFFVSALPEVGNVGLQNNCSCKTGVCVQFVVGVRVAFGRKLSYGRMRNDELACMQSIAGKDGSESKNSYNNCR